MASKQKNGETDEKKDSEEVMKPENGDSELVTTGGGGVLKPVSPQGPEDPAAATSPPEGGEGSYTQDDAPPVEIKKPPKPQVYFFISRYLGLSFPDPRAKMPEDPHLAKNWIPPIIQFVNGQYQTRDEDEAKALIKMHWIWVRRGMTPDFRPIDKQTAKHVAGPGAVDHGPVSTESAGGPVPHYGEDAKGIFAPAPK